MGEELHHGVGHSEPGEQYRRYHVEVDDPKSNPEHCRHPDERPAIVSQETHARGERCEYRAVNYREDHVDGDADGNNGREADRWLGHGERPLTQYYGPDHLEHGEDYARDDASHKTGDYPTSCCRSGADTRRTHKFSFQTRLHRPFPQDRLHAHQISYRLLRIFLEEPAASALSAE